MGLVQDGDSAFGATKPTEIFRPAMGNVVAGFIISVLLVLAAASVIGFPLRVAYRKNWNVPVNHETDLSWVIIGLAAVFGIGIFVGAIALALYTRTIFSHRVDVFEAGFCYHHRRSDDVLWADIVRIQESIHYERASVPLGAASLLMPKIATTSYTVFTKAGDQYEFDSNSIRRVKRLGKLLREKVDLSRVIWETTETH